MKENKLTTLKLEKNIISRLSLKSIQGGKAQRTSISLASRRRQCNETFLC